MADLVPPFAVLPVAPARPSELRRTPRRPSDEDPTNPVALAAPRQRQPWRRVALAPDLTPSVTSASDDSQRDVGLDALPYYGKRGWNQGSWFSQELSTLHEEMGALRGEGSKRAAQHEADNRKMIAQIQELELKVVSMGDVAEAMGHRLRLLLEKESERFNRELVARQEAQPALLAGQDLLPSPAAAPPDSARTQASQELPGSAANPQSARRPPDTARTQASPRRPGSAARPPVSDVPQNARRSEDVLRLQVELDCKRLDEVEVELVHLKALTYRSETERGAEASRLQSHLGEARDDIAAAEERFARALLEHQGETAESCKRLERRLQAHIADVVARVEFMVSTASKVGQDPEKSSEPQVATPQRGSRVSCFALHEGLSGTPVGKQTPAQQLLEGLERHPYKVMKDNARIKPDETGARKDFAYRMPALEFLTPALETPGQQLQKDNSRPKPEQESERGTHQRLRGMQVSMERHRTLTEEAVKAIDEKVTQCLAAVDRLGGRASHWENLGDRLQRHVQNLEESCNNVTQDFSGAKLRGLVENACNDLRQELRKQVLEPWRLDYEADTKRILELQRVEMRKAMEALRQDLQQEAAEASLEARMDLHGRLETFAESLKARCGLAEAAGQRVEQHCNDSVTKMHEVAQQQLVAGEDLAKRVEQGLKGISVVAELTRRKVDDHAKALRLDLREELSFGKADLESIIHEKISAGRAVHATEVSKMNGMLRERMESLEGALQSRMEMQVQGQRALSAEWANHQAETKLYLRSLWDGWEKAALDREHTLEKEATEKLIQLREELRNEIPLLGAKLRAVFAFTTTSLEHRAKELEDSVHKACNHCETSLERVQAKVEDEAQAIRRLCHEELRVVRSSQMTSGASLGIVKESRLRYEVCNLVAMIAVREVSSRVQQRLAKSEVASLRTAVTSQSETLRSRMEAELGAAQSALRAASSRMEQQPNQVEMALRNEIAQATANCFMKAVASDAQIREEMDYIWRSETAGLSDRFADLQEEVRMLSQLLPRH